MCLGRNATRAESASERVSYKAMLLMSISVKAVALYHGTSPSSRPSDFSNHSDQVRWRPNMHGLHVCTLPTRVHRRARGAFHNSKLDRSIRCSGHGDVFKEGQPTGHSNRSSRLSLPTRFLPCRLSVAVQHPCSAKHHCSPSLSPCSLRRRRLSARLAFASPSRSVAL